MNRGDRREGNPNAFPLDVFDSLLVQVEKPSRYIGGEAGAVVKNPADVEVRWVLAFPDLYEVGMSHFGYQILYGVLNRLPWCAAERVYAPGLDLERVLRDRDLPLSTLETRMPLAAADAIGFTLQYELCATGVLQILDLAGLRLRAADRQEDDPLVIAGGPCATNPEPWAPFFDAIFIGEGEESVVETAMMLRQANAERWSRARRIEALAGIGGYYVPTRRTPRFAGGRLVGFDLAAGEPAQVRRRVVHDLENAPVHGTTLLPNALSVHNRLAVEVQRGCTRGCRFCHAGYFYRPVRERSAARVEQLIEQGLAASGHGEVSLLSLSSGDWTPIAAFLPRLMRLLAPRHVALSLPSLRAESLTGELAEAIRQVRRTGFAVAPEAATERMRRVINKPISDETVLQTARTVYGAGWDLLKLYFMVGLPTETDADVEAILSLIKQVFGVGREINRRASLNATISVFVPKPHTPFQRFGMLPLETARRRLGLLGRSMFRGKVTIKSHEPRTSQLEGAIARGDRRVADALEEAYRRGARLDGWAENFDYARWQAAFAAAGLDLAALAEQVFADDDCLPWSGVDLGVSAEYLLAERDRALAGETTPDCRDGACGNCGVCGEEIGVRLAPREEIVVPPPVSPPSNARQRLRLWFAKRGPAKWLGHLEMVAVFTRAATRAGLPLAYSEGFHPQPRLSFGPPLSVGVASDDEVVEFLLAETTAPEDAVRRLSAALPAGLEILRAEEAAPEADSLFEEVEAWTYEVDLRSLALPRPAADAVAEFLAAGTAPVEVVKKGKTKTVDARALVRTASVAADRLRLVARHESSGGLKPQMLVARMLGVEATAIPPTVLVKRATHRRTADLAEAE